MMRKTLWSLCWVIFFVGCADKLYVPQNTQKDNISISAELSENKKAKQLILPYKKELENRMNKVLAYAPIPLHKSGYNSPLTLLVADLVLEESQPIYQKKYNGKIDFCLLNHGGIRRIFDKGNLTVQSIYELMPFENEVVAVDLSGEQVTELIHYLKTQGKPHPIAGIEIDLTTQENTALIQGKAFDPKQNYTVVTNDYLQSGGDNMNFLKNPIKLQPLDIKLRDMMLHYFEKIDTVKINNTPRYILK